jgi:hypothetical protein
MVLNVFLMIIVVMETITKVMMFPGMLIVMMVLMKMHIFVHANILILAVGMEAVIKIVLKENGNVLMVLNVFLIIIVVMETITKVMMFPGMLIVMMDLMKMHIFVHVNLLVLAVGMEAVIKTVLKENGNVLMVLNVFLIVIFVMEMSTKVIK